MDEEWPDDWDESDKEVYKLIIALRNEEVPPDEISRRVKKFREERVLP